MYCIVSGEIYTTATGSDGIDKSHLCLSSSGESWTQMRRLPWMLCWPETMPYQHFSAREDADTAMLTFSLGTGNLCDIVRGKRYGTGCAQIMI